MLLGGGTTVLLLKQGPQEKEQASGGGAPWGAPGLRCAVPAEHLQPGIGSWPF